MSFSYIKLLTPSKLRQWLKSFKILREFSLFRIPTKVFKLNVKLTTFSNMVKYDNIKIVNVRLVKVINVPYTIDSD